MPFAASPYEDELAEAAGRLPGGGAQAAGRRRAGGARGPRRAGPADGAGAGASGGPGCRGAPAGGRAGRLAGGASRRRARRSSRPPSLRGRLGLVTEGYAIGPFGEGRASFRNGLPARARGAGAGADGERITRAKRTRFAGGVAGAVRGGELYLDGLLRPDTGAVGYSSAFVRSDRARPAALRLGPPGRSRSG